MTNFEKFRQELTIERLAQIVDLSHEMSCSSVCPAKLYCQKHIGADCPSVFTEWAKEEVQDD